MAVDLGLTLDRIRQQHRERNFAMRQRTRLDLALGAFLRMSLGWSRSLPEDERAVIAEQARDLIAAGDKVAASDRAIAEALRDGKPLPVAYEPPEGFTEWAQVILASIEARAPFDEIEARATKAMDKLAKTLPVWPWAEAVRGLGAVGLAGIVGEAGDLAGYDNPAKLWKRMGLAVMDGVRQGKLGKNAIAADWIKHGYKAGRRSVMWNVGQALVKSNGEGPYRALYLERKAVEHAKALAEGLAPATTTAATAKSWGRLGLALERVAKLDPARHRGAGHMEKRAQRYMEKRLLRDLWRAWRDRPAASESLEPEVLVPPAGALAEAAE